MCIEFKGNNRIIVLLVLCYISISGLSPHVAARSSLHGDHDGKPMPWFPLDQPQALDMNDAMQRIPAFTTPAGDVENNKYGLQAACIITHRDSVNGRMTLNSRTPAGYWGNIDGFMVCDEDGGSISNVVVSSIHVGGTHFNSSASSQQYSISNGTLTVAAATVLESLLMDPYYTASRQTRRSWVWHSRATTNQSCLVITRTQGFFDKGHNHAIELQQLGTSNTGALPSFRVAWLTTVNHPTSSTKLTLVVGDKRGSLCMSPSDNAFPAAHKPSPVTGQCLNATAFSNIYPGVCVAYQNTSANACTEAASGGLLRCSDASNAYGGYSSKAEQLAALCTYWSDRLTGVTNGKQSTTFTAGSAFEEAVRKGWPLIDPAAIMASLLRLSESNSMKDGRRPELPTRLYGLAGTCSECDDDGMYKSVYRGFLSRTVKVNDVRYKAIASLRAIGASLFASGATPSECSVAINPDVTAQPFFEAVEQGTWPRKLIK